jgi:uncharacterized Zn finger protein
VAERRRRALLKIDKMRKQGRKVSPVALDGRVIAKTFWGKAWCDNLESYSDYENRLPRGRTYVRNGSVMDLQIAAGRIEALVSGSKLYRITIEVKPVAKEQWKSICADCAGGIDSLVELLQGRLSRGVMERICRQRTGLFPSPQEIKLDCSCPDWAGMCKHVAAVLYGVGARLDAQPEMLFRLRQVDEKELIASVGKALPNAASAPQSAKVLKSDDLSAVFGLDMAQSAESPKKAGAKPASSKSPKRKDAPAAAKKSKKKPAASGSVRGTAPAKGVRAKAAAKKSTVAKATKSKAAKDAVTRGTKRRLREQ